ncbi:hypothetical protein [Herbiconiux ginsengi]|uniref:Pectate lyase superfamily protein n=1 Tax=Herbiconiux ginsengi TaxID=381665 RepID=A0A1H3SPG1_9MICO|nr:hypothetical protein [Herbiconiux ginsengi]SDZ39445.1 hypothetical protein SAMN05216554_3522 [Herbiconiux ginsengi]
MGSSGESSTRTRRNLLIGGGLAVAGVALVAEPAHADVEYIPTTEKGAASGVATLDGGAKVPATQIPDSVKSRSGSKPVGQGEQVFNVRDFGNAVSPGYVVGSGGDDTLAFQAAIDTCYNYGGTVFVPPGNFRAENLVVTRFTVLEGVGSGSRFGTTNAGQGSSSSIVRPTGSDGTAPMITVVGPASGLRRIYVNGAIQGAPTPTYGTGPGIIMQGFESILDDVRIIYVDGIGIDVQRANNPRFTKIRVDNCGSTTEAAVKIWSRSRTATTPNLGSNETNTVDFYDLTIERSRNRALDIAYGTTQEYWAEWIRFYGLHIESSYLDHANDDPLVAIGQVRGIEFYGAMIYGGPGRIVRHQVRGVTTDPNTTTLRSYGNGGIRFIGGSINGSDATIDEDGAGNPVTALPTPVAFDLVAGGDFMVIGTRITRITTRVFSVQTAYGKYSYRDLHTDLYDPNNRLGIVNAGVEIVGAPTIAANGSAGVNAASMNTRSDDVSGRVFFGTNASPTAGIMVTVTRYHNDGRDFTIQLTPKTAATAALGLYAAVQADKSAWTIRAANPPAASQAATAFQVDYALTPVGSGSI